MSTLAFKALPSRVIFYHGLMCFPGEITPLEPFLDQWLLTVKRNNAGLLRSAGWWCDCEQSLILDTSSGSLGFVSFVHLILPDLHAVVYSEANRSNRGRIVLLAFVLQSHCIS